MKIARITNDGTLMLRGKVIEYPSELSGGRNLISESLIGSTAGIRDTSEYLSKGVIKFSTSHAYGGVYITAHSLLPNTEYVMSYRYKKTSGTLVSFGGHTDSSWNNTRAYVDGVGGGRYSAGSSVFVSDDNLEHEVVIYINTPSEISVNHKIEIQPNRGSATPVDIDIYDLKLEEGNTVSEWTPAPEDLGLVYPSDINYFKTGFRNNGDLFVNGLIKGINDNLAIESNVRMDSFVSEHNGGVTNYVGHVTIGVIDTSIIKRLTFQNGKGVSLLRVVEYGENMQFLKGTNTGASSSGFRQITVSQEAKYIRISFRNTDSTPVDLNKLEIKYLYDFAASLRNGNLAITKLIEGGGDVLVHIYVHQGNKVIQPTGLDKTTGLFTTTEPIALSPGTKRQVITAFNYQADGSIPREWKGADSHYIDVVSSTSFYIRGGSANGEILTYTNTDNNLVDVNSFRFEYDFSSKTTIDLSTFDIKNGRFIFKGTRHRPGWSYIGLSVNHNGGSYRHNFGLIADGRDYLSLDVNGLFRIEDNLVRTRIENCTKLEWNNSNGTWVYSQGSKGNVLNQSFDNPSFGILDFSYAMANGSVIEIYDIQHSLNSDW